MKTLEILFAQVVNSLILKVQNIAIFVAKFFFRSWIGLSSQFCVCYSHNSRKLAQGKFAVRQGKRNLKMQFGWGPRSQLALWATTDPLPV